ncbi:hypothetical protein GQ457_14G016460 [Hibiscus cannabinus]
MARRHYRASRSVTSTFIDYSALHFTYVCKDSASVSNPDQAGNSTRLTFLVSARAGTCVLWTRVNATIMDTILGELYTEYGWRVVLL